MEILTLSCIHNDIENIMGLVDQAKKFDYDVVVFPGDFTDLNFPKHFDRIDITKIILAELQDLGKPLLCVPGSWDKDVIDLLDKKKVSVHGKGTMIDDVGFYGYGGARTPFGTPFEPQDDEIELGLIKGYKQIKDAKMKVQVTHMPPARTAVDRIPSGAHVGSEGVRRFIENAQPNLAISAHIHEARGTDDLKRTILVNPGRLPEGSCAVVSMKPEGTKVKMLNLIEEVVKPKI